MPMRPIRAVLIVTLLGRVAEGGQLSHGTVNAAAATLRARSAGALAGRAKDQVAACSCDCCVAGKDVQASRGDGHVCQPRAERPDNAGCQAVCQATDEVVAAFQSKSDQVDYARYCLAACSPTDDEEVDMLCMAVGLGHGRVAGNRSATARPELAAAEVGSKVSQGTQQEAPVSAAVIQLARGEMLQAKRHAVTAGESARAAREAYEAIVANGDYMGRAAAKATVDAMRKEAGMQAKRALKIRQKWEDGVRHGAAKAAINAAVVYQNAKQRDMLLAGEWQTRAGQFASAASASETAGQEDEAIAAKYRSQKKTKLAKEYATQANMAFQVATEYEKRAEAAGKQADAIRRGAMWYDFAAQSMADNVLYGSIPPGVAPPVMPPLR